MESGESLPLTRLEEGRAPSFHPFEARQPVTFNNVLQNEFLDSQRSLTKERPMSGHRLNDVEINAISMSSINERDLKEMDTDKTDTMDNSPDKSTNKIPKKNNNNNLKNCSCYYAPSDPFGEKSVNNSLYFADGLRSIDFVLAWNPDENESVERTNAKKREIFERNLINEGLEIECETLENDLTFVKIHAPLEVLRRYSEILKLRMPMKESLCQIDKNERLSALSNAAEYISQKVRKTINVAEDALKPKVC